MEGQAPDFNIDNYDIGELLTIFGIESPIKKEAIMKIAGGLIEKYKELGKSQYVEFFSKAMNRLLSDYEMVQGILGKVEDFIETAEEIVENKDKYIGKAEEYIGKAENYIEKAGDYIETKKNEILNPPVEDAGPNILKNMYYNGNSIHERIAPHVMPNRANYIDVPEKGVGSHAPQLQNRLLMPNAFAQLPFAQGYRNPTLQNAFLTWLNVDSQYREIRPVDNQTAACANYSPEFNTSTKQQNEIHQEDTSTDFTFSLATPVTNVLAMTVGSIEVPLAGYYAFSDAYGNTTFEIDISGVPTPFCIRIPEGNYDASGLTNVINGAFETLASTLNPSPYASILSNIKFIINKSNQKAYIYYDSSNSLQLLKNISFNWGDKSCCGKCNQCCDLNNARTQAEENSEKENLSSLKNFTPQNFQCSDKNKGKKLNSTFGWTIGFREYKSTFKDVNLLINPVADENIAELSPIVCMTFGSCVANLLGTKYFILEIDDFNHNRNNGEMATMSMPSLTEGFSLPNYAKNVSQIYPVCDSSNSNILPAHPISTESSSHIYKDPTNVKAQFETFKRPCRKGTPAEETGIKGKDTLTQAQKYTATELRNTQKTTNINQYFSPQSSNILFRFPAQRLSDNLQVPMIIPNSAGLDNARRYFGPVTIEKLRVRLLDDKGYPVDLHCGDISFSLLLERLYQY